MSVSSATSNNEAILMTKGEATAVITNVTKWNYKNN